MVDEQITENSEPIAEPSAETAETQVTDEPSAETNETQVSESIDYTEHLILIEQGQQVQAGLMCVMIGLILISVIFNVFKRFF